MASSDNLRGIGLMCLSMAAFTVNDTFMKAVTAEVPLFQAVFLRGVISTLGLLAYGAWIGALRPRLERRDWGLIGFRSVAEVLSTVTFLVALTHMHIANLSAIMQFLPLAVTLGAAIFLGDKVGWRRALAIVLGLIGVLIIIQPGTENFDSWSMLGVAAVLFVVMRDLVVRRMGAHVPSVIVALGAAISVLLTGLLLSLVPPAWLGEGLHGLTGWVALTPGHAGQILGAGAFLIIGYLSAVTAMRWGDIGVVAPFRYTSLLWAIVLGILAFGEIPNHTTLIGAAIVVASGLYTLWRERAIRQTSPRG